MRLLWTTRAADQLVAAVDYLESERAGSGVGFHEAVRQAVDLILDHPRLFPSIPDAPGGESRRALIRRWHYWLLFEVRDQEDTVVILAFWSARRRPGGWRED